jgi:hypothetical protein
LGVASVNATCLSRHFRLFGNTHRFLLQARFVWRFQALTLRFLGVHAKRGGSANNRAGVSCRSVLW